METTLTKAGLWTEVKDRLDQPGTGLSGGQQQRLCIARTIAVNPEVILMDEPCSALDPISTAVVEDLIDELREQYSIAIVTHSMQQASRVSQRTAYFHLGELIEIGPTEQIFTNPNHQLTEMLALCGEQLDRVIQALERGTLNLADQVILQNVMQMAHKTKNQFNAARQAYLERNALKAIETFDMDDEVDALYREVLENLRHLMATQSEVVDEGSRLLFVARSLERAADHSVNVANHIHYLVTGRYIDKTESV